MGFCLFQHIKNRLFFFVVNPAYVSAVVPQHSDSGRPVCLIEMSQPVKGFEPLTFGEKDEIEALLKDGSKIGFDKVNVRMLVGARAKKPQGFRMTNANRVMLVRELFVDEIGETDGTVLTASQLYVDGEQPRLMVERPGVFAMRANAEKRVPRL